MTSSLHPAARIVRFDESCLLIPDVQTSPKLVTRTYSLPLWRRSHSDFQKLNIKLPTLQQPRPRSVPNKAVAPHPSCFARGLSRERSSGQRPRSPCAPPSPLSPSLSAPLVSSDATFVPLRACCATCLPAVEQTLADGPRWTEKFSTGAKRRRSSASDGPRALEPAALCVDELAVCSEEALADDADDDGLFPLPVLCPRLRRPPSDDSRASTPPLSECGSTPESEHTAPPPDASPLDPASIAGPSAMPNTCATTAARQPSPSVPSRNVPLALAAASAHAASSAHAPPSPPPITHPSAVPPPPPPQGRPSLEILTTLDKPAPPRHATSPTSASPTRRARRSPSALLRDALRVSLGAGSGTGATAVAASAPCFHI